MPLPNAERAFIDIRKLEDYVFDPTHPVGQHKALLFRRVLGSSKADAAMFRELLLRAGREGNAIVGRRDEFGRRYTVDFPAATAVGSAWIVRAGEDLPRLTTCFVLPG